MIRAVVPDSWMPLRCMTNAIGAPCRLAPMKPFSAWPEIQPASPQWQMTNASAPWLALAVRATSPRVDRHRHAETARADRRAAGHPRHVAGDVEAAAELFDDALARQEAERRQRRVVADAGVAVLDRELRAAVIDRAERHQQRADQLEAAAEMIDVVDLGERDQRLDRDPSRPSSRAPRARARHRREAPAP